MVVSSAMKLIITRTLAAKTDADGVQTATVEVSDYYSHLWVRDLNETVISAVYDDDTTPSVALRPADDAQTTVYDFTD